MTAIVPVFNEEVAVGETLKQLRNVLRKSGLSFEILAIDDGSSDRSYDIIKQARGVKALSNAYNLGYGATLKRGLKEAKGEYILILDSDGSYPIDQIPRLIEHIHDYDMVVGARDRANVPTLRKPAKFILRNFVSFVAGRKISDENSGMRVFRKDMAMEFFNLYPNRFSFTITITLASITRGYTVKFVPIDYHKRKGRSSMGPFNFVNFTNLIFRIATYFNPFKVFSSISALLLLLTFMTFIYTFFILGNVMDITVVVIALSAVQIFLFGLVADIIIKKG